MNFEGAPRSAIGFAVVFASFVLVVFSHAGGTLERAQPLCVAGSDSLNMRLVGCCNLPEQSAHCVEVVGSYAYVANKTAGIRIVDISEPANPHEVGRWDTPGVSHRVYVTGSLAYVADEGGGLRVLDVSDPTSPFELGFCITPDYAHGVFTAGAYAYVADEFAGVRIVDVSDPTDPREVGYWDSPGRAFDTWVTGDYLYLADMGQGLWVLDVSDPALPKQIGHCDTHGDAYTLFVSGPYVYIAADNGGLRIIDVSVPGNPYEVGWLVLPDDARDVNVVGPYAYVADDWAGLRMIDVSEPAAPVEVGYYYIGHDALAVSASGRYAYLVGDSELDFCVIENLLYKDICDPVEPWEVRTQGYWRRQCKHDPMEDICAYVDSVHVVADLFDAFDCDSICGLMNVNPPENDMCRKARRQFMALLLNVASGKLAVCNCLEDGREVGDVIAEIDSLLSNDPEFYTCERAKRLADDINNGIGIVPCDTTWTQAPPKAVRLPSISAAPNPFSKSTAIEYEVNAAGHVRLDIYDKTGKLVRTVVDNDQMAGLHQIEWDGLDQSGQEVPQGIYFSRLEVGNRVRSSKLIMLR